MAATRTATVTWNGTLAEGSGTVSSGTSGQFTDLPVSWASRTEDPEGRTSPEELLAAAHASCFAWPSRARSPRRHAAGAHARLRAVTFDKVGEQWTVTRSELDVVGVVPGLDEAGFDAVAREAKDGCPVSRALAGNVEITVHSTVEDPHD
jgi:lipoyl-dependent peroxiredoxin